MKRTAGILTGLSLIFAMVISVSAAPVQNMAESGEGHSSAWLYICIAVLAVVAAAFLILFVNYKKRANILGYNQSDLLTGMGNLNYIRACYGQLEDPRRKHYCLAYIGFGASKIEERFGVTQSEELQKFAAQIIGENCGDFDYSARIDNGVFVILFSAEDMIAARNKVDILIERLNNCQNQYLKDCCAPFHAGLFPVGAEKAVFKNLLSNAKLGYTYACENNVNYLVCTKELLINESSRERLRSKLSYAIDSKQFDVFLQFIYSVSEGKFTSAEVLSRWNNPHEGFLMPAYYINDMRNTGIIDRFDFYMLDKTCKLLEQWKDTEFRDLKLSCNITRITISSGDFMQNFRNIIKKYHFNHSCLILEITEDALIDNRAAAYRNISECKKAGFQIAIDDFGAGHSSISDLCDYPVDIIKIDRHVINKSTTERGSALIQGIVKLAHELGIEVLCEGVETQEQLDAIMKNDCDYIQGYYYSYVFPVEEGSRYYTESIHR